MFQRTFKFLSVCVGSAAFLLSFSGMPACRAQNLFVGEYLPNDAVQFAPDGTNLGIFASAPSDSPGHRFEGLTFDANGYLYVARGGGEGTSFTSIVSRFSPSGTDLGTFLTTGLNDPTDVTFDKAGNLYVSSYGNSTVHRYSSNGTDLGVFASVPNPDFMAFDQAGNLYVSSDTANYVRRFSPTGTDLGIFASGFSRPGGIAFDAAGNVYVADRLHNSIRRFSPDGTDLGIFANTGLDDPLNLAFDAAGNLYVSNIDGSTVRHFSPTGADLGDFATGLHEPGGLVFFPLVTAINVANVTGAVGQTVTLSATLRSLVNNAPLPNKTVQVFLGYTHVGNTVTDSNGVATFSYKIPDTAVSGTQTITFQRFTDAQYNGSQATGTLTVTPADTYLTVSNVTGAVGQTVTLSGVLYCASDNAPQPNKTVQVFIGYTHVGNTLTDSTGTAHLSYKIPDTVVSGTQTITFQRFTDAQFNGSQATGTLTVTPANIYFQVVNVSGARGHMVTLSAVFYLSSDNTALPIKTVSVGIDGVHIGDTVTDSTGTAHFSYTIPTTMSLGKHTIIFTRFTDAQFHAGQETGTLTVTP